MILHTIMNLEWVLHGEVPPLEEFRANGILMQGIREKDGMKLVRVICSDPLVYLQDAYQPGKCFPLSK